MKNYLEYANKFESSRSTYSLTISKHQIGELAEMLKECQHQIAKDNTERLELLVLEDIRDILRKKFISVEVKTVIKLNRAQARTMFMWLNEYEFKSHRMFACQLVKILFDQIV